jgi:hypothetical protein
MSEPFWQPSAERIAQANLTACARMVAEQHGAELTMHAMIHGRPLTIAVALAKPQSLALDRDLPAARS